MTFAPAPLPPPTDVPQHDAGRTPDLSVVLLSPDVLGTQKSTVTHLRNQTIRDRIEVVIVSPSLEDRDAMEPLMDVFRAFRFVPSPPGASYAQQQAMGIRAATAPIVATGEDHCQPHPAWAEKLVEAFGRDEKIAGVSPAVCIANDSLLAVGSQLIDYLNWTAPVESGEVRYTSVTNTSYRRELIVREYGDDLHRWIARGGAIHDDLRSKGYRFWIEAEARCYHKNISRLPEVWRLRYNVGRFHAGTAAQDMPAAKRLLKVALTPLLPLARMAKVVKRLCGRRYPLTPRMLLGVWLGLLMDAAGQFMGYAFGPGHSAKALYAAEFHREPRMLPHERNRNYVAEYHPEVRNAKYVEPVTVPN